MTLTRHYLGHKLTIDTTLAPSGARWTVVKDGDVLLVSGDPEGEMRASPARPVTVLRVLLQHTPTASWVGTGLTVHAVLLSWATRLGGPDVAALMGGAFLCHALSLWPLVEALKARIWAIADLNALRVKYKLRTGDDA